jgi:hypothetical protein
MQRRDPPELLDLLDGKIADADGADLSLPEQRSHRVGGFRDRNVWVGPMHLIDVDVIGSQPAKRVVDLPHDPRASCVSEDFSVVPFKTGLGRKDHL